MKLRHWFSFSLVAALSAPAAADHAGDIASLKQGMPTVVASPGRDKAPVRAAPWCAGVPLEGSWSPNSIGRALSGYERTGSSAVLEAATIACHFVKDPDVNFAVAAIEQQWINHTGLAEADAVASLTARVNAKAFAAAKLELCGALTVSDEWEGEERDFMKARRELFGCVKPGNSENPPLWLRPVSRLPSDLLTYVDLSAKPVDEIVRLALLVDHTAYWLDQGVSGFAHSAPRYIFDQYDFKALSPSSLKQLLDTAPYKGNVYARTIALESLARVKLGIAGIEGEVAKITSDADWKELLVTAPQRGLAAWQALASANKDALARSSELERTFFGPSRKAGKGCYGPLHDDLVGILKTLPHDSEVSFREALSKHPIASVLISRLAACASVDDRPALAAVWTYRAINDLRGQRGPRMAMYYAAFDALSKILADRAKFPVALNDLKFIRVSPELHDAIVKMTASSGADGFSDPNNNKGVVKTVKKTAGGLALTFVTQKHEETYPNCTATSQIINFRSDGSPMYYMTCGKPVSVMVNDTPDAVTVSSDYADGIGVGSAIELTMLPDKTALPKLVYKDKSRKQLVNWYGLGL